MRPFFFRNPGEPRWPPEHKVLSIFDPPAKDSTAQTQLGSVSDPLSTSGEVKPPNPTGELLEKSSSASSPDDA